MTPPFDSLLAALPLALRPSPPGRAAATAASPR